MPGAQDHARSRLAHAPARRVSLTLAVAALWTLACAGPGSTPELPVLSEIDLGPAAAQTSTMWVSPDLQHALIGRSESDGWSLYLDGERVEQGMKAVMSSTTFSPKGEPFWSVKSAEGIYLASPGGRMGPFMIVGSDGFVFGPDGSSWAAQVQESGGAVSVISNTWSSPPFTMTSPPLVRADGKAVFVAVTGGGQEFRVGDDVLGSVDEALLGDVSGDRVSWAGRRGAEWRHYIGGVPSEQAWDGVLEFELLESGGAAYVGAKDGAEWVVWDEERFGPYDEAVFWGETSTGSLAWFSKVDDQWTPHVGGWSGPAQDAISETEPLLVGGQPVWVGASGGRKTLWIGDKPAGEFDGLADHPITAEDDRVAFAGVSAAGSFFQVGSWRSPSYTSLQGFAVRGDEALVVARDTEGWAAFAFKGGEPRGRMAMQPPGVMPAVVAESEGFRVVHLRDGRFVSTLLSIP